MVWLWALVGVLGAFFVVALVRDLRMLFRSKRRDDA